MISSATFLELVGGVVLIIAGDQLKDEDLQIFDYGVSAGVFAIIAAITCIISIFVSTKLLIMEVEKRTAKRLKKYVN